MSRYYNVCNRCGAALDPGEKCSCMEESKHRNLYQRKRDNYEATERLGGFTYGNIVRTDRAVSYTA